MKKQHTITQSIGIYCTICKKSVNFQSVSSLIFMFLLALRVSVFMFLLALRVSVKQKEAYKNLSPSLFSISSSERVLFSFWQQRGLGFLNFAFSIPVFTFVLRECVFFVCESEREQSWTSETRETPTPPKRVCGCIFIDYCSLYFLNQA